MARSLVVPEAGQTVVRVASFSDKVLTLRSHLPVAEYHTVSGVSGRPTLLLCYYSGRVEESQSPWSSPVVLET